MDTPQHRNRRPGPAGVPARLRHRPGIRHPSPPVSTRTSSGSSRARSRSPPSSPNGACGRTGTGSPCPSPDGRTSTIPRSTTTRSRTTPAPKSKDDGPKSLDEVDPKLLRDLRKARDPAARARPPRGGWRSMRCSTASPSPPPSRTSWPSRASSSARSPKRCASTRRWSRRISAPSCPTTDNFFATLNSAVFSDGSFCYVPKGLRCPMELSTYFRINAAKTGQFERTLVVADEGSYVSYLEGCTAPARDENQLHAAVVEARRPRRGGDQVLHGAELGTPGDEHGHRRHLQLRHQARRLAAATARRLSWTQVETGSAIT